MIFILSSNFLFVCDEAFSRKFLMTFPMMIMVKSLQSRPGLVTGLFRIDIFNEWEWETKSKIINYKIRKLDSEFKFHM